MAHSISEEVSEVLRAAACSKDRLTLVGQLDRKMYEATNKILEISGFKWNRKEKCHLAVNGNAAETLAKALDDGRIVDPKKEWDFFQTPEDLADRMAALLEISELDIVLEPSAGGGRLIRSVLKWRTRMSLVWAIEAQAGLRKELAEICNVLEYDDFLKYDNKAPSHPFEPPNKIIMNPPFSSFQDIIHCRHAYDQLESGGRMVCITGPSWQFRTDKKSAAFKAWFESLPSATIEELPAGTFKDSGTNVRALLLIIDKEIK